MDDHRFDDLTKAFACTSTRRGAFRLIGGALAGVFGARAATAEAARGDRCTTSDECGACLICEPGRNGRPGRCVADSSTDGQSCGGDCGMCMNGRCRAVDDLCFGCDRCDGRSLACVESCRPDQVCCDGRCRRPGDGCCTDDSQCGECETCAGGACVPRSDSSPCGVCGVCSGGTCVAGANDVCGDCATCSADGSACEVDEPGTVCGECGTCSGRTCVPTVGMCSQDQGACSTCDPNTLKCSAAVRCDACEICGQDGCARDDAVLCGDGQVCCDQTGECGPADNPCCANGVVCGGQCCTVQEGCCDDGCCCAAGTQFCPSDEGHVCCDADQLCCFGQCIGINDRCCGEGMETCGDACCEAGRGCCAEGCCCAFGLTLCQGSEGESCCEENQQCCDGACIPAGEECCPSGQFNIAADQCCPDGPACEDACCAAGEICCGGQCIAEEEGCCFSGELPCHGECCPDGLICGETGCECENGGTACPDGWDGWDGYTCCVGGEQCCNHNCIPAEEECCEGVTCLEQCCEPEQVCGEDGCCTACGATCCLAGTQCCHGECIPDDEVCCRPFETVCGSACCGGDTPQCSSPDPTFPDAICCPHVGIADACVTDCCLHPAGCCQKTVDGVRMGVCCDMGHACNVEGEGPPVCCGEDEVIFHGACVDACVPCEAGGNTCCDTGDGIRFCCDPEVYVCTLSGCCLPHRVTVDGYCF